MEKSYFLPSAFFISRTASFTHRIRCLVGPKDGTGYQTKRKVPTFIHTRDGSI